MLTLARNARISLVMIDNHLLANSLGE